MGVSGCDSLGRFAPGFCARLDASRARDRLGDGYEAWVVQRVEWDAFGAGSCWEEGRLMGGKGGVDLGGFIAVICHVYGLGGRIGAMGVLMDDRGLETSSKAYVRGVLWSWVHGEEGFPVGR